MKIEHRQVGSVDVLAPIGPLVDVDAEQFAQALLQRLQSANPRVVVSLQEVSYLDSVAIEGLLTASDKLAERAMPLKMVQVTPTCREILELTGRAGCFSFFNEIQDAVKSFL